MSETFDLAGTLANYDLNESTLRRILAERMARLAEDRKKGIQGNQNNSSARGMLQSTAALTDVADTNLNFDRQVGDTNDSFNSDLMRIAQGRVDAQNQYQLYLQNQAKENAKATQTFDPTDPYNWKGIAAEQAKTAPAPADPSDPFNWKGIAAEQAAQGQLTVKPGASVKPRPLPQPLAVKPAVSNKPRALPKQGYY
jgi:hypothetical protein